MGTREIVFKDKTNGKTYRMGSLGIQALADRISEDVNVRKEGQFAYEPILAEGEHLTFECSVCNRKFVLEGGENYEAVKAQIHQHGEDHMTQGRPCMIIPVGAEITLDR